MKSRVIHSRIDEETLLSCVEFFNSRGGQESAPLSTKVSVVLATFMHSLREGGELQSYYPDEVESRLDALLQKPAQLGPVDLSGPRELYQPGSSPEPPRKVPAEEMQDFYDEGEGLTAALDQAPVSENPREALRSLIDDAVTAVTQPRAELDPDIWAPDPNELPDPGEFFFDVQKQPRTSSADLPHENPLVLRAIAFEDSVERTREVLICQIIDHLEPLDSIDPDIFWGLHKKMVPIVDRYLEESETEKNA